MEKVSEYSGYDIAQRTAESLRTNPNIVGVWVLLDPHQPKVGQLISQRIDQSAELTEYKPGMQPEKFPGRIIFERKESGNPIRQIVFVANSNEKRIIIGWGEF